MVTVLKWAPVNSRIWMYMLIHMTTSVTPTRYDCSNWKLFVTWWRHQMEAFSPLLAICAGNSPVTGEFPTQRPVTRSFVAFFDLRINGWVNNRKAGDLRRHRTYYDSIVMRARYVVHAVYSKSVFVAIVLHVISCYIGPCNNDFGLYHSYIN